MPDYHPPFELRGTITDRPKDMAYAGGLVVKAEQYLAKVPPEEYSRSGYKRIIKVCGRSGLTIG